MFKVTKKFLELFAFFEMRKLPRPMRQPINALNEIQFMTIITLLHVSTRRGAILK